MTQSFRSRSAGLATLGRTIEQRAATPGMTPMFCVVIDLGDLHRSDRVARTLGPGYADGLADAAKRRIRKLAGPDVALSRIDTDCFAFVLCDHGEPPWRALVESLIEQLTRPLRHAGLPGAVTPHAGLARFTSGPVDAEDIARRATAAALEARDADVPWRLFDDTTEPPNRRLHAVLSGLPAALAASDQLWIAYQPRIALRTGDCVGAEALLRWNHPTFGAISPGEFIPLAEQSGMARFVTDWVLDHALEDLAAWTRLGSRHAVSVNVSAVNLAEEDFAGRLGATIRRHGVDPGRVELEFTEGALVRDSARVRGTINELTALGVEISIDDFGTGYSNLRYLRDIDASVLKIDQSFIRWLAANDRDPIIVRSMIELGHALGYRVVAEGIEDEAVQAVLAEWGCDEGQGYHICRPIPAAGLLAWLAEAAQEAVVPPP